MIDIRDVTGVLAAWGAAGVDADLNADGGVDGRDLAIVLGVWGASLAD